MGMLVRREPRRVEPGAEVWPRVERGHPLPRGRLASRRTRPPDTRGHLATDRRVVQRMTLADIWPRAVPRNSTRLRRLFSRTFGQGPCGADGTRLHHARAPPLSELRNVRLRTRAPTANRHARRPTPLACGRSTRGHLAKGRAGGTPLACGRSTRGHLATGRRDVQRMTLADIWPRAVPGNATRLRPLYSRTFGHALCGADATGTTRRHLATRCAGRTRPELLADIWPRAVRGERDRNYSRTFGRGADETRQRRSSRLRSPHPDPRNVLIRTSAPSPSDKTKEDPFGSSIMGGADGTRQRRQILPSLVSARAEKRPDPNMSSESRTHAKKPAVRRAFGRGGRDSNPRPPA